MSDDWLIDRAKRDREVDSTQRRETDDSTRREGERLARFQAELPEVWDDFVRVLERKAKVFNDQRETQTLTVESSEQGYARTLTVRRTERDQTTTTCRIEADPVKGIVYSKRHTRTATGGTGDSGGSVTSTEQDGKLHLAWSGQGAVSPEEAADKLWRELLGEVEGK